MADRGQRAIVQPPVKTKGQRNRACSDLTDNLQWQHNDLVHLSHVHVMTASGLPSKLKHDAIVEAVLELRFESSAVPEVFYGRLADNPPWANFTQRRLPSAEIPTVIRDAELNLRFQPVFELVESAGNRVVRVGPRVLTFHVRKPYIGWAKFRPELEEVVDVLFKKVGAEVKITRIGLRYINAFTEGEHGIAGVKDLNLSVTVGNASIEDSLNLNFMRDVNSDTRCMVRVASADFVQGTAPFGAKAWVDVDVFTPDGFKSVKSDVVKEWIVQAHDTEKHQFFGLLKSPDIERLTEA